MKAHKYLMPRLVISAVYVPPEYDGNPQFFTVTSPLSGISTVVFLAKSIKNDRKFHSNSSSTGRK
jgi:hypothetical protein